MLKSTTTLSQSGPGSNDNEIMTTLPRTPEMEPHHQIQFKFTPSFLGGRRG